MRWIVASYLKIDMTDILRITSVWFDLDLS